VSEPTVADATSRIYESLQADNADIDVLGAQQSGMDAAWINPEGAPLPPGITPPRYELRDLADLGAILGV